MIGSARDYIGRRNRGRRMMLLERFVPTDIIGLQLWLDANDPATLFQDAAKTTAAGDGDVVGAWADKSNVGNDVIQATTASKPIYHFNILNGLPIVRFDGADDYMRVASLVGAPVAQPTTLLAVIKLNTITPAFQVAIGGSDNINRQNFYKDNSSDKWAFYSGTPVVSGTTIDTSWHIVSAIFNGASSSLRLDKAEIISGDSGSQGQQGITIGAGQGASLVWDGDYAEIAYYNRELNSQELAQVENYFTAKWGV